MWKSVNCEVQGRGHIATSTPCQDKTKQLLHNDVSVIVLADGAGSAKLSHFGAECIVDNMSVYIADNFQKLFQNTDGKQVKFTIIEEAKRVLGLKAVELECKLGDLASTLLLVAIRKEEFIIIHIGDGVIGYLDGSELKVASIPDNGEFANVTTFVTSSEALVSMRLFKGNIKDISGFVLMSDGTEQSLYNKQTKTLASAIVKLMQRACVISNDAMQLQLFNTLKNVISQRTQDDCSIAIIARTHGMLLKLENLSFEEQLDLFFIYNNASPEKRLKRYNTIIKYLEIPRTLDQISTEIHLKRKYTKAHLEKLKSIGLIVRKDYSYYEKIK